MTTYFNTFYLLKEIGRPKMTSTFLPALVTVLSTCIAITPHNFVVRPEDDTCTRVVAEKFFTPDDILVIGGASTETEATRTSYIFTSNHSLDLISDKINNLIIETGNVDDLASLLETLRSSTAWNPRAKYLVTSHDPELIPKLFQILFEYDIYNAVALDDVGGTVHSIDFKRFRCDEMVILQLGACGEAKLDFPATFSNCPIKITWDYYYPYIVDVDAEEFPGVWISLLRTVAQKDNLELVFGEPTEK